MKALDGLADKVVFIGGAIAPLLQEEPPFRGSRSTKDVDAVVGSQSYGEIGPLHDQLRMLGFRQVPTAEHMHRWESPTKDGEQRDLLDLVPAGEHPGGTGQKWDHVALRSVVTTEIGEGVAVRHASAPAFLGLKWAAFDDRGAGDPRSSHDLEDVVALLVSRPSIVEEIDECEPELRAHLVEKSNRLASASDLLDLLASHLNNADNPAVEVRRAEGLIRRIGGLSI